MLVFETTPHPIGFKQQQRSFLDVDQALHRSCARDLLDVDVVAKDPAGLCEGQAIELRVDAVLGLEAVLHDFELQPTDSAEDRIDEELVALAVELDSTFVGELLEALFELLAAERIFQTYAHEMLGRKARDAFKGEGLAVDEGVADAQVAAVPDADDVAGVGLFDRGPLLGHEDHRSIDRELLDVFAGFDAGADADLLDGHALFKATAGDPHKGDSITVLGIHVRLDLEHEAGEGVVDRVDRDDVAQLARARVDVAHVSGAWCGAQVREAIEKWFDTEVRHR